MIRVLVVDDHPLFREGLIHRLNMDPDITVIAEAENGKIALDILDKQEVDVVLTDINMPEIDGMYVLELINEKGYDCKVLILSMHDNEEYIVSALNYGAHGYVLKDVPGQELIRAIKHVQSGKRYFSPEVTEVLSEKLKEPRQERITRREQLVLRLVSRGLKDKLIANELSVSVRTIEAHKRNIKAKLSIDSTAGLVRYAIEYGLDK